MSDTCGDNTSYDDCMKSSCWWNVENKSCHDEKVAIVPMHFEKMLYEQLLYNISQYDMISIYDMTNLFYSYRPWGLQLQTIKQIQNDKNVIIMVCKYGDDIVDKRVLPLLYSNALQSRQAYVVLVPQSFQNPNGVNIMSSDDAVIQWIASKHPLVSKIISDDKFREFKKIFEKYHQLFIKFNPKNTMMIISNKNNDDDDDDDGDEMIL